MVVFMVPPTTLAELEEDLSLLRAACAGAAAPEANGLIDMLDSRRLDARATIVDVERAWRAAMDDAGRTIVAMKKSLAAHIRARTEPARARDELRALAAAVDAIKRRRELQRG